MPSPSSSRPSSSYEGPPPSTTVRAVRLAVEDMTRTLRVLRQARLSVVHEDDAGQLDSVLYRSGQTLADLENVLARLENGPEGDRRQAYRQARRERPSPRWQAP